MGECKRHPGVPQPGGGVCSSCLHERLTRLWRGESFHLDAAVEVPVTSSAPAPTDELSGFSVTHELAGAVFPIPPQEAIAIVGSIASIRKQLQVNGVVMRRSSGGRDAAAASKVDTESNGNIGDSNGGGGGLGRVLQETPIAGAADGGGGGDTPKTPRLGPHDIKDIMKEWAELHGRRRNVAATAAQSSPVVSKKLDIPMTEGKIKSPLADLPAAGVQSIGCRSMPLVNKFAEETALRVIGEQAAAAADDDKFLEALEAYAAAAAADSCGGADDASPENLKEQEAVACFSPKWQGKLSSKKWVKVLVSPMISSNKVFPSRSKDDVRKAHAAAVDSRREGARDGGEPSLERRADPQDGCAPPRRKVISRPDMGFSKGVVLGMPDQILQHEDMGRRLIASRDAVLLWLQDLPSPQTPLFQKTGQLEELSSPSSFAMRAGNMDARRNDLAVVGQLHEIAEEHEAFEESSVEEEVSADLPSDISSFGKFLVIAARRQPKSGLVRVVSASSGR